MKKITLLIYFLVSSAIMMAATPSVVISGVYGGGGNSGAPVLNDYIELYNTTASPIDMEGWTIYYIAATGTNVSAQNTFTFPEGTSIGANSFLLLQGAKGAGSQTNFFTADLDLSGSGGGNFNLSGTSGRVLLLSGHIDFSNTGTAVPNTTAGIQALAGFVDYVAFGSVAAALNVGTAMVNLSNTTAATRTITGTTVSYTPDMKADFTVVTLTASVPRNSSTTMNPSAVAQPTFSPAGGAYATAQNVTITTATEGASIYYTTDGTTPTVSSTLYSTPIPVSADVTLKAIAIKGSDNSAVATAIYTFPVEVEVANIAEFIALSENTVANITGPLTVVTQQGSNLFVQDASGWLLIYGTTAKTYQSGDQLTNVAGKFLTYTSATQGSYPELELVSGLALPDGVSGTPAVAAVVNPANLTDADLNRYVAINNAVIADNVTYATTGAAEDGTIVNGEGTMIIRNQYNLVNASFVTGDIVNLKGIVRSYNAIQIYLLSIVSDTGFDNPQSDIVNVYAENGTIYVKNLPETGKISVYDLTGKLIIQTNATEIPLTAKGIYVVKVNAQAFKVINK